MRVYRDKHNCFHAFSNIVLLTCMKYLHYVCQKYVVALEATGIIKTERLANPCSISFANPTFTFSLVVWDKFCGQGAKILAQHLREIWLHLGKKYLLNFSKKYCCTWARCTRAGWKCIVKTGSQANPERPWVERQIPSCCSQQNRIFSSFLQFFFFKLSFPNKIAGPLSQMGPT